MTGAKCRSVTRSCFFNLVPLHTPTSLALVELHKMNYTHTHTHTHTHPHTHMPACTCLHEPSWCGLKIHTKAAGIKGLILFQLNQRRSHIPLPFSSSSSPS